MVFYISTIAPGWVGFMNILMRFYGYKFYHYINFFQVPLKQCCVGHGRLKIIKIFIILNFEFSILCQYLIRNLHAFSSLKTIGNNTGYMKIPILCQYITLVSCNFTMIYQLS